MTPTFNLEFDLCQSAHIVDHVKRDAAYAQNLYAALCNNKFQFHDSWYILQGRTWICTWRRAAAIIADMRGDGDYLDWYCSGMMFYKDGDGPPPTGPELDFVPEGMITSEIAQDLKNIGWRALVDQ